MQKQKGVAGAVIEAPEGLSKGGSTEQAGHGGGRSPPGSPSGVALLGYSDPAGLNILIQDILFEKSPKWIPLNGILWLLRTGVPWRDVPERYGPWSTIASRFYRWRKAGIWARLFATVQQHADRAGQLDWDTHYTYCLPLP